MHLTPNMYKIIILQANAKEIITLKCPWCQICTKSLLWRQMGGSVGMKFQDQLPEVITYDFSMM